MKILIVSHYFWPENFRINSIAEGLNKKGHDITVLTGIPNYPSGSFFNGYNLFSTKNEYYNNIKILRATVIPRKNGNKFWLILNYISFVVFGTIKILFLRNSSFDKILIYQAGPMTTAIPAYFAKKKFNAKMHLWLQDLWPHSLQAVAGISNKYLLKKITNFCLWVYNQSDKVIVQSEGFIKPVIEQGCSKNKLIFIPNTIEDVFQNEYKKSKSSVLSNVVKKKKN